jgi:osmotically-inducible protein OsmY
VVVVASVLNVVPTTSAQDAGRDRELEFTAQRAVQRIPALLETRLDVSVTGGVATVEGTVRTLRKKWDALEAIAKVRGITAIDDRVRLDSKGYSDDRIDSALRRRIDDVPALRSAGVKGRVEDGVVTLTGSVGDARLRYRARDAAAETDGVVGIIDRIDSGEEEDEKVERGVLSMVGPRAVTGIPGLVDVAVVDGVVTLTGSVPTLFARLQAERLAFSVNGVKAVQNFLEVVPEATLDDKLRNPK